MKIGILTFHRAYNYGAMLQAYALHKVLSDKGYNVEFLSYRNERIEDAYRMFRWTYNRDNSLITNIKGLLAEIILFFQWQKRRHAFRSFAKQFLPESEKITERGIRNKSFDYDALFFGSDQIWTTRFLKSFDPVYWGEVDLKHGAKIAYAPSMELSSLNEEQKVFIRQHLVLFDALSARETKMAEMLSEIFGNFIPTVLDPTFLCESSSYEPLLRSASYKPQGQYILIYQVGDFAIVHEIADYIAKAIKCQIVEIRSNVSLHKNNTYQETLGPADFVSLIANATFVLSCSFHGTAFAVNFKKPFYSVLINGMDSRVKSLLSQIGLSDRGINSVNDINIENMFNLDYQYADGQIARLRAESLDYIDSSLKHICKE